MRTLVAALALALGASGAIAEGSSPRGYIAGDGPSSGAALWTGAYVGANINYSWADVEVRNNLNPADGVPPGPWSYGTEGLGGGIVFGYNKQFSALVVGIEVEGGSMNVDGGAKGPASSMVPFFQTIDLEGGLYGTLAARLGVVLAERTLFYGKAGYTWTDITASQTTPKPGYLTNPTGALHGFTYGGGIEYMADARVTLRLEYLRYDLGKSIGDQENVGDFSSPIGYRFTNSHDVTVDTVKLGINFKMN